MVLPAPRGGMHRDQVGRTASMDIQHCKVKSSEAVCVCVCVCVCVKRKKWAWVKGEEGVWCARGN